VWSPEVATLGGGQLAGQTRSPLPGRSQRRLDHFVVLLLRPELMLV